MQVRNRTQEVLKWSLEKMATWYQNMIAPKHTDRFIYELDPVTGFSSLENCPIRELGSIWDILSLSLFLKKYATLPDIANRHLSRFTEEQNFILDRDRQMPFAFFTEEALNEPSNISHSAFLILALVTQAQIPSENYANDSRKKFVELLANGILEQQRSDGSFQIHFDWRYPDHGMELYSGEAMLSLVEAYKFVRNPRYLDSVSKAYYFYSGLYHFHPIRHSGKAIHSLERAEDKDTTAPTTTLTTTTPTTTTPTTTPTTTTTHHKTTNKGRGIAKEYLVFFANWMSQALTAFYFATTKEEKDKQESQSVEAESVVDVVSASGESGESVVSARKDFEETREEMRQFVFDLHDRIIEMGFYEKLKKYPRFASTVEVACGLEGICDAYSLLLSQQQQQAQQQQPQQYVGEQDLAGFSKIEQDIEEKKERTKRYEKAICLAIEFLLRIQRKDEEGRGRGGVGGFGYSVQHQIQRIDVTGHVANAFMKAAQLGISVPILERK